MTKKAYFIISPDYIEGDGINYHLFNGMIVDGETIRINQTSMCGNVDRKSNCNFKKYNTENNLRTTVAEMQNDGKNICGQCVATLYADDED